LPNPIKPLRAGRFSRKRSAEIQSINYPQVVFERDGDGNLELIGYSVQSAGQNIAFRLKNRGDIWQAARSRRLGGTQAIPVAAVLATTTIP
jgi:hypothetical protein